MLKRFVLCMVSMIAVLSLVGGADAKTYHVAPAGSAVKGGADGSAGNPWGSVDAAFASKKIVAGDILLLQPGSHGDIALQDMTFAQPVTIMSEKGKTAHVNSILARRDVHGVIFKDMMVWGPDNASGPLVFTDDTSSDLAFEGLIVQSRRDVSGRKSWSADQWVSRVRDGIMLFSPRTLVRGCKLRVVRLGISSAGANSQIWGNSVVDFAGDGIRAGDYNLVRNNLVANSFRVDDNHNDGFQSWAGASGRVVGLILRRNRIYEWTYPNDHPLRGSLQGMGLFDGFYDDLVIANNIVSVTAQHGIAVYGARNARIVNNTVVSSDGQPGRYPWLLIGPHKNGTPSSNVTFANNIAMAFLGTADPARSVVFSKNAVIATPAKLFRGTDRFDFRLKDDSGFIDKADPAFAPPLDVARNARPNGAGPDLGAYESPTGGTSQQVRSNMAAEPDFGDPATLAAEIAAIESGPLPLATANEAAAANESTAKFVAAP
jgi:Right handed beta helix region